MPGIQTRGMNCRRSGVSVQSHHMRALVGLFSAFLAVAPAGFGQLSKEALDLSLEPPLINTRPGAEFADEARIGNMIIGIERTPKGRLWACWVGNGDSPNGFFM